MIAIVDYDAGNILSVENALKRLGAGFEVTSDPLELRKADHVILPGVGEASSAMSRLDALKPCGESLSDAIRSLTVPVLGICIGMQLLCASSEEGNARCLGIFQSKVRCFPKDTGDKVPHIGWNTADNLKGPLFKGIPDGSFFYYVHSFYPETVEGETIAVTQHAGRTFSSALRKDNFFGTQFHPEKSGRAGSKLIENFLSL